MTTRHSPLPTITISVEQVGLLGLTLGRLPDVGGGRPGPEARSAPLLAPRQLDERAVCDLVHAFVHHDALPDLAACPAYAPGRNGAAHFCRRAGRGTPCAFHEAPDAAVWTAARQFKRVRLAEPGPYGHDFGYSYDPHDRCVEDQLLSDPQDAEPAGEGA